MDRLGCVQYRSDVASYLVCPRVGTACRGARSVGPKVKVFWDGPLFDLDWGEPCTHMAPFGDPVGAPVGVPPTLEPQRAGGTHTRGVGRTMLVGGSKGEGLLGWSPPGGPAQGKNGETKHRY